MGRGIMMFGQDGPAKVLVATRPLELRKGIDGLALAAQTMLGLDPFPCRGICGAVFMLRSNRADRIKLPMRDQTGMVLVRERLEGGKFAWPRVKDGLMRMSWTQMAALFEGLDRPQRAQRPLVAG